jgi:tRNA(Ile)-lysidine synthase
LVAASGGPDSGCLLHLLQRLRPEAHLVVAHVDHGLSEDSEAIAADLSRRAAADGLDVHVARARGLEGSNLHARARDFRYSFFETIGADEEASAVATGHTLDDRVETTLARLVHGAGTDALSGIGPLVEGPRLRRVRPLLDLRRAETRAYCDVNSIAYVDDPANSDERFERPAVRRLLVGAIEERWGEGAIRAIATSAERLREDALALTKQAATLYEGMAVQREGATVLDLPTLLALPRALRRRVLEAAVGRVRDRNAALDEVLDALDRPDRRPSLSFAVAGGGAIHIGTEELTVTSGPRFGDSPQTPRPGH